MHHEMLPKMYMIDFLGGMNLVEGIQIHKVFVMSHHLFVHQMLLSKIQTRK